LKAQTNAEVGRLLRILKSFGEYVGPYNRFLEGRIYRMSQRGLGVPPRWPRSGQAKLWRARKLSCSSISRRPTRSVWACHQSCLAAPRRWLN